MIQQSVADCIGKTPLLRLRRVEAEISAHGILLVKAECMNPAGSAKDRVALQMIRDAESKGLISPGDTIIEPTSGNTGIGLASLAAAMGYRVILTMPDSMSVERRLLLKAYGAEIVLTEGKDGMAGAIQKAEELHRAIPKSFLPDQFSNPSNPKAHYLTTGPEIWADAEGKVDVFISAVGTGGTISGCGAFLKEMNPKIQIIAVEPRDSAVLSGKKAGPHKIQGIGAGFIPKTLNTDIYDKIFTVSESEAYEASRLLAKKEGLLTGISSGAALSVGMALAKKEEYLGKSIVVLLPDSGERYLSTPLFGEE